MRFLRFTKSDVCSNATSMPSRVGSHTMRAYDEKQKDSAEQVLHLGEVAPNRHHLACDVSIYPKCSSLLQYFRCILTHSWAVARVLEPFAIVIHSDRFPDTDLSNLHVPERRRGTVFCGIPAQVILQSRVGEVGHSRGLISVPSRTEHCPTGPATVLFESGSCTRSHQ